MQIDSACNNCHRYNYIQCVPFRFPTRLQRDPTTVPPRGEKDVGIPVRSPPGRPRRREEVGDSELRPDLQLTAAAVDPSALARAWSVSIDLVNTTHCRTAGELTSIIPHRQLHVSFAFSSISALDDGEVLEATDAEAPHSSGRANGVELALQLGEGFSLESFEAGRGEVKQTSEERLA